MAGATFADELTSRRASPISFSIAGEEDDEEIRRLLRENPMEGHVRLSFEREPSYFKDVQLLDEARLTIIARNNDRLVCMGSCSFNERFINGETRTTGYLAGLRLDAAVAGRFDILRRGYRYFDEARELHDAPFYFTTVAAGNQRAMRFLERGLPGMPAYNFVGELVTLLLTVPSRLRKKSEAMAGKQGTDLGDGKIDDSIPLCDFLNKQNNRYQLSPKWSSEKLLSLPALGLQMDDFVLLRKNSRIVGCAALWDQRCFKQAVVRGYSRQLKHGKPWLNLLARLSGRSGLPEIGVPLPHAYVSHLAMIPELPELLVVLVQGLLEKAAAKGVEFLTLGFSKNDPRLQVLRRQFNCREYQSHVYSITWPDENGAKPKLDGRLLYPEVCLL
ncbi:MAG TPA: hypothetical protein VMZ27_05030 [Candidatus Saccharimonadales bacterium]|nr:hypothetical protein [Candidatus Saccharimonadales bacterium]